jgi:hypothetical protein
MVADHLAGDQSARLKALQVNWGEILGPAFAAALDQGRDAASTLLVEMAHEGCGTRLA